MPAAKFLFNTIYGWEQMLFQDGGHFGYQNRIFLEIPKFHVAPMPTNKFQLNLAYD